MQSSKPERNNDQDLAIYKTTRLRVDVTHFPPHVLSWTWIVLRSSRTSANLGKICARSVVAHSQITDPNKRPANATDWQPLSLQSSKIRPRRLSSILVATVCSIAIQRSIDMLSGDNPKHGSGRREKPTRERYHRTE